MRLHKETQGLFSQNGAARRTERKTATKVWLDKDFVQRRARDTEVGGLTSQFGSAERKIMADLPRALSPTLSPPTSAEMITAGGLRARPAEAEMQAAGSATRGTSALRGRRRVCDL